uniref:RAD52 motif containing 1 n=1 Tax=Salmo trutta TaxID=8032 RepID=A0A673Y5F0_SALTR
PLYLVKVCPNAAVVEPGFYALVKYFSAAQAWKMVSPLFVKLSTKQYPNFLHNSKPLSHRKCQDFANHYMGFNGWHTHIVTLKDISNCDDAGRLSTTPGDPQEITRKYGCIMEVTFPQHGLRNTNVITKICLPGNGKVLVECRMERDDVLQDEDLEGLIRVNVIPWCQFDPDCQEENEDIPWELSVNM